MGVSATVPPREVRGMETAAARPGPRGTVAGPRGVLRGGGGGGGRENASLCSRPSPAIRDSLSLVAAA